MTTEAKWEVVLFGRFGIRPRQSGVIDPLVFRQRHPRQLLAHLVLNPGRRHARRDLVALLWPDKEGDLHPPTAAQRLASLRGTLNQLRKVHPALSEAIGSDREHLWLEPALTSDVERFEQCVKTCPHRANERETLTQAVALYQGDLLPGWNYVVEDEDPPLLTRRYALREACAEACVRLMRLAQEGDAQTFARRAIELAEPGTDPVWLAEARALARVNENAIQPASGADLSINPWTLHLPALIGRQAELALLRSWFHDPTAPPLLTLTGRGGSGKTRIAQAFVVSQAQAAHIAVVNLSAWREPETLLRRMVDVLYPNTTSQRSPLELLQSFARDAARPALLILDTVEHLLPQHRHEPNPVADQLMTVLRDVPSLRLLVTSQTPVGLSPEHERVCRVRHLSLPPENGAVINEIARAESVQLFVQAASRGRTPLHLNGSNAQTIASLCRLVNGHPLSLRLAAAQYPTLRLSQIQAEIQRDAEKLREPRRKTREKDPRHVSLESVIAWAFHHLSPQEQAGYLSLSVFCGGFTHEAVEAVCGPGVARRLDDWEHRALLDIAPTDERVAGKRYHVLDSLRAFATKNLSGALRESLRERHSAYFTEFAERAAAAFRGPKAVEALFDVRAEFLNLTRAIDYEKEDGDKEHLGRTVSALSVFVFSYSSLLDPLRAAIEIVLEQKERLSALVRARSLIACVRLSGETDDSQEREQLDEAILLAEEKGKPFLLMEAYSLYFALAAPPGEVVSHQEKVSGYVHQALQLAEQSGDAYWHAAGLHRRGSLARRRGEMESCIAYYRAALHMIVEADSPVQRIVTSNALCSALSEWAMAQGIASVRASFNTEAVSIAEEAYELAASIGFDLACAGTCGSLHSVLWLRGDCKKMYDYAQRGLAHLRAVGGDGVVGGQLQRMLAVSYILLRKWDQSAFAFLESLEMHKLTEISHRGSTVFWACHLAIAREEMAEAARLLGCALSLHGSVPTRMEQALSQYPPFATQRAEFGPARWKALVETTQPLSPEDAVAYARAYLQKICPHKFRTP